MGILRGSYLSYNKTFSPVKEKGEEGEQDSKRLRILRKICLGKQRSFS